MIFFFAWKVAAGGGEEPGAVPCVRLRVERIRRAVQSVVGAGVIGVIVARVLREKL